MAKRASLCQQASGMLSRCETVCVVACLSLIVAQACPSVSAGLVLQYLPVLLSVAEECSTLLKSSPATAVSCTAGEQ